MDDFIFRLGFCLFLAQMTNNNVPTYSVVIKSNSNKMEKDQYYNESNKDMCSFLKTFFPFF